MKQDECLFQKPCGFLANFCFHLQFYHFSVDVICSDERFSTLCTLAQAANLETVLGDNRSIFTVFAPTNDAIEKLLATGVDTSDPVFMEYLLSTHVVVLSQITSSDIDCTKPELPPLLMANDELTNVICDSGSIFVVGGGNTEDARPKVVDADIETCNGIIHAIDTVILPQAKTSSQQKEDVDEVVETGDCEPLSKLCIPFLSFYFLGGHVTQ